MLKSLESYTTRKIAVVTWRETLTDAYDFMISRQVRHLPVIDDEGHLVGLISDRDFQRAMRSPDEDFFSPRSRGEFAMDAVVRDHMSWPVETISEDASVATAAKLMIERKISALVVSRGDEAIGIVTTEDLLRALVDSAESPMDRVRGDLNEFAVHSRIGGIAQRLADFGI